MHSSGIISSYKSNVNSFKFPSIDLNENSTYLFLRSSGEQRTSKFLMWQSAYAEMVFMDVLWPDADRRTLWRAIEIYAERERRFGKA